MSEVPTELPPPRPGTLGTLRPPLLHWGLFALTALSATAAGALLDEGTGAPRALLVRGLAFAAALLAILLSHEMGHFLLARRHGVDASWPFFIPAPLVSFIGTLGAVIRLRSLPRTRRALLDIGAAGPIAGFLVTLPVLLVGLKLSTLQPLEATYPHWTIFDALWAAFHGQAVPELRDGVELGEPLAMLVCERLVFGAQALQERSIALHPVAVAGWFGLLLTALNLLPVGQLDGGHLLYGLSPRLHRALSQPLSALLFAMGIFTPFTGWALWGLATGLWLARHPPLPEPEPRLDRTRIAVLLVCVAIFVLSFTPAPISLLAR